MVLELAKSAIEIKLAAKVEAPIISTFEYCYASGLACSRLHIPKEQKDTIRDLDTLKEVKKGMTALIEASDFYWTSFPNGERLKSLILKCRIDGVITEEARLLFDLGFNEK